MLLTRIYYLAKPLIPRRAQIQIMRLLGHAKRRFYTDSWPILPESAAPPPGWQGWPNDARFALALSHDVETFRGHERCRDLLRLEKELGFASSFNFVPERYPVSPALRAEIIREGFEVGVHGLRHDGKLYNSRKTFSARAQRINRYLAEWKAVGFRSPAMHHNLAWIHELDILYDASTFDTDPFEPQNDGLASIFPRWIPNPKTGGGYVEIPYTIPQDHTMFIIFRETRPETWIRKLDWIAEQGGMAFMITHPDYICFNNKPAFDEYPYTYYSTFLEYIQKRYSGKYWHVLPRQIASFWKRHYRV